MGLLKSFYVSIVMLMLDLGDEQERKGYGLVSDGLVYQVDKG